MKRLIAFLLGLIERNSLYGTHLTDYTAMQAYDKGRNLWKKPGR